MKLWTTELKLVQEKGDFNSDQEIVLISDFFIPLNKVNQIAAYSLI